MSLTYTEAKRALASGEIDLHTGGDDIRAIAVMTNTTADTEEDVTTVSGFTTFDECDDTTYARITMANEVVASDNANDRAEFDADDLSFTFTGDATRQIAAILIIKHVTNDTDSVPLFYIDSAGFPFTATGSVTIQWNAEGIWQLT